MNRYKMRLHKCTALFFFSFYLQACFRSSTITKYLASTPPLNNNETPQTHTHKKGGGGGGGWRFYSHLYNSYSFLCQSEQTTFVSGRKCYISVKNKIKIQRNNKKSGNWITAEDEQLKHYATSAILDLTFS